LFDGLPRVVAFRVSPPFKEILKSFVLPEASVFPYCFHFVFILALDKIRRRAREVGAVRVRFDVWGKKTGMEDGMYVPLRWEF